MLKITLEIKESKTGTTVKLIPPKEEQYEKASKTEQNTSNVIHSKVKELLSNLKEGN